MELLTYKFGAKVEMQIFLRRNNEHELKCVSVFLKSKTTGNLQIDNAKIGVVAMSSA